VNNINLIKQVENEKLKFVGDFSVASVDGSDSDLDLLEERHVHAKKSLVSQEGLHFYGL